MSTPPESDATVLPTYAEVWQDIRRLDAVPPEAFVSTPVRLVSNMEWGDTPMVVSIRTPRAGGLLRRILPRALAAPLASWTMAFKLFVRGFGRRKAVLVEGTRSSLLYCLARSFLPGRRASIVLFGFYLYPCGALRRWLFRRALRTTACCIVWSRRQGELYAEMLDLPQERFLCLPFKSNHSGKPGRHPLPLGPYVFSGGISERDYETFFEAVAGLDVPVVVSATDPAVLEGLAVPRNVIVLAAHEPHFGRLMASSAVVVVPLTAGRVRGAGEGTILDGMWHARPVVCADDVSAAEYVDEGRDGWVVPPGDAAALRRRIEEALADPERAAAMGRAGHAKVEAGYTHELWRSRILKLACLLARDGPPRPPLPTRQGPTAKPDPRNR